jgi:hypothetical protein
MVSSTFDPLPMDTPFALLAPPSPSGRALLEGAVEDGLYGGIQPLVLFDLTQAAPRWGSGSSFDGTGDAVPKDMLDLVCRIYSRERLRLVPAVVCNGAVPALEALAAREGEPAGILCVGRDGRLHPGGEGARRVRYNILDPRVQDVVERLVSELADRTSSSAAVDGIAILLSHDGWLHVPGVAWALDDTTFGRFIAAAGQEAAVLAGPVLPGVDPNGRRFEGRAALVEGPLREQWLTWREGEVAAFYGRLADAVAARKKSWSLYVTPTTLFVEGELAARFRPTLLVNPPDADVMRSIALDTGRITAHDRIVYVSPHVHAAADDVVERGVVQQANQSLTLLRGAAQAARRGAVFVEQPLDLDLKPFLPHSPFVAAKAGPVPATVTAVGAAARPCTEHRSLSANVAWPCCARPRDDCSGVGVGGASCPCLAGSKSGCPRSSTGICTSTSTSVSRMLTASDFAAALNTIKRIKNKNN